MTGVDKFDKLLNVAVPGHNIDLTERTDLLILSDLAEASLSAVQYFPEVMMLIEVKGNVKACSHFQALSELIALDLLVDDPVMAPLTDFKGEWLFFLVTEKKKNSTRIHRAAINKPGEAFEVIRTLLAQTPTAETDTDTEIDLPCFQHPVKRLKLTNVLPPIGEGGESGGVRECIERYYDTANMLVPDIDMARAVARQVPRFIPAFSSIS